MTHRDGTAATRRSHRILVSGSYRAVGGVREKYAEVHACLERYLSKILVESVLSRALTHHGLSAEVLTMPDLEAVVEDSMVGLRLFVPADRLPDLMVELSEILTRN